MALDPRIPMMLGDTGAPFTKLQQGMQLRADNKARARQLDQNDERIKLMQQRAVQDQQRAAREREEFRLTSVATAAMEMLPAIQSRDTDAVVSRLRQRRRALIDAGITNTEDTDESIQMAIDGDWEGLQAGAAGAIQLGFSTGLLKSQDSEYGRVIEGVDDSGNPSFFQVDGSGNARKLEGFAPAAKNPLTVTTPDGTVISMGGTPPPTDKKLTEELVDLSDTLDTLDRIEEGFQPEFHTLGTRFDTFVTSAQALAGMKVSDEDKKELQEYSTYVANVSENQSKVMNRLSGAAVSPSEAKRLNPFILQPGDDPITAEAKMRNFRQSAESAIARRNWLRFNNRKADNANFQAFPLEGMPAIIKRRSQEITDEITRANPSMPAARARELMRAQLKLEFGL